MHHKVTLCLEDGSTFAGESFGGSVSSAGEVVFTTGMVGYPETLTDPSYRGQILVMTYPLVGNYGIPRPTVDAIGLPSHFESSRIQIAGLIVSEHCEQPSHWSAETSLSEWLEQASVPGIAGIDTRALTQKLREHGTMLGKIVVNEDDVPLYDPNAANVVEEVSHRDPREYHHNGGDSRRPTVLLLDCGTKANIIRSLYARGIDTTVVPYDDYFLDRQFDGILISNGPGDPKMCSATIKNVERALALGKPILGICLGNQVLALASGAETYKLKYGHRSQNQPCTINDATGGRDGRCYITSQNHGFAVHEDSLGGDWRVWFSNINDGTVEGIRHVSRPYLGVQFHPEANPGPTDTNWIFDEFKALVEGGSR